MDQPTATLVAGIVTALGSTTIGVTAVLVSWRSTRAALRQQERLVVAEKLWERRADTYVELMAALNTAASRVPDRRSGRVLQLSDLLTADFFARLSAYDIGTVRRTLNDHLASPDSVSLDDVRRSVREALGQNDHGLRHL